MVEQLKIRAVQMDLARQPETVVFIKSSIDFFHQCGYNYLVLYLEGRIRTKSFHSLPENESYSPDEIRDIVGYAQKYGIETIPVVSVFGHADLFLEQPENESCAELRGGIRGRFGTYNHVFCPTQPETLNFIERYLTEVAELFPSRYFHVGFDEAWDIGYCEKCRVRLPEEGQSGIFLSHLKAVYNIVAGKLGKTMLMWDDLFDIYPDVLERIPRDIVFCSWHYETLLDRPYGHAGAPRSDLFKRYDELGFRYIFAPAAFSMRNIQTFTEYALAHHPFGALLTVWEAPGAHEKVAVAYAGRLWSGNPDSSMEAILRETTPLRSEAELAMAAFFLKEHFIVVPGDMRNYFGNLLNPAEYDRFLIVRVARDLFMQYKNSGNDVLEEMMIYLDAESIYFALRQLLPRLCCPGVECDISGPLAEIKEQAADINRRRKEIEKRLRPDRMSRKDDRIFDYLEKMLTEVPVHGPVSNAVLRVRYPERVRPFQFFVRYAGSSKWSRIESGCTGNRFPGERMMSYPFELQGVPEALRIDFTDQYVGSRIMYAELETAEAFYQPLGIVNIEGAVSHPEALLNDGRDAAFFGDGEVQAFRKFNHQEALQMISSVELLLKKISK